MTFLFLIWTQLPTSVDTNTIFPFFSAQRTNIRLHMFYSEKGLGQAALVYDINKHLSYGLENEQVILENVPEQVVFSLASYLNDAAMVVEYEGPDGDINLAPLQKFEFYEYQKNHYLIPHLGNSEQWANTLFFGSDQQVKLSLEIGGEPGYELISDPLQVGTWAFENIERGKGFVRLLNHTENPTLGNDAYWNGIFEFARRDGIAGSAAIAPIPYRTTPGSTSLVLPHVAKDQENFWTGYSLLNPGDTTTLVQGVAYGYQGEVLAQTDFLLPPQTQDIRIIQKLFPSLPIPTIAWIRFTSETPICGIELFGSPNPKKGYLAGFELAPSSRLAQLLLFPAVGFDSDRVTGLSLVNPHSQSISIEIALCQDVLGGDNLVQLGNYQIPAFGKWTALLDDLRQNSGIPHSQMRAIRVYSNLPITGFVLIANNELTQLGGYLGIPGSPD